MSTALSTTRPGRLLLDVVARYGALLAAVTDDFVDSIDQLLV